MTWVTGARAGAFLVKEAILTKRAARPPSRSRIPEQKGKVRTQVSAADDHLVNQLLVMR